MGVRTSSIKYGGIFIMEERSELDSLISVRDSWGYDLHLVNIKLENDDFEDFTKEELLTQKKELQLDWDKANIALSNYQRKENEKSKFEKLSKNMYETLTADNYYEFLNKVKDKIDINFLATKTSKTDFRILILMMNNWNKETSLINIKSFDDFLLSNFTEMNKGNLSRCLKSLETNGFIRKIKYARELQYEFLIAYSALEEMIK